MNRIDLSFLKIVQRRRVIFGMLSAIISISLLGCGTQSPTADVTPSTSEKVIQAVGAENEYADVIKQIGGKYVTVAARAEA